MKLLFHCSVSEQVCVLVVFKCKAECNAMHIQDISLSMQFNHFKHVLPINPCHLLYLIACGKVEIAVEKDQNSR